MCISISDRELEANGRFVYFISQSIYLHDKEKKKTESWVIHTCTLIRIKIDTTVSLDDCMSLLPALHTCTRTIYQDCDFITIVFGELIAFSRPRELAN
jgi:hypothetical protein